MLATRKYYSVRTGKNKNTKISIDVLKRLAKEIFADFQRRNYFQEYFGYRCIDAGNVVGKLGEDIEARIFQILRKENLWPFIQFYESYSEEDLFDIIEFLYDCVSKPIEGIYHSYGDCGWHYDKFDTSEGRKEFSEAINAVLADYSIGYKLSEQGEIQTLPERGLEKILEAKISTSNPENIEQKIDRAINKFLSYKSSIEEKREAVRELADVLEFIRPQAKEVLDEKDESDLFNIINNFGIRHHNPKQKTNYDRNVWLSWMFYINLSTIYAIIHLLKKKGIKI